MTIVSVFKTISRKKTCLTPTTYYAHSHPGTSVLLATASSTSPFDLNVEGYSGPHIYSYLPSRFRIYLLHSPYTILDDDEGVPISVAKLLLVVRGLGIYLAIFWFKIHPTSLQLGRTVEDVRLAVRILKTHMQSPPLPSRSFLVLAGCFQLPPHFHVQHPHSSTPTYALSPHPSTHSIGDHFLSCIQRFICASICSGWCGDLSSPRSRASFLFWMQRLLFLPWSHFSLSFSLPFSLSHIHRSGHFSLPASASSLQCSQSVSVSSPSPFRACLCLFMYIIPSSSHPFLSLPHVRCTSFLLFPLSSISHSLTHSHLLKLPAFSSLGRSTLHDCIDTTHVSWFCSISLVTIRELFGNIFF